VKSLKRIAAAALAVLVMAVYLLPAVPASAATSASLSIVPKKNYVIEPGKTVNDSLVIRNLDRTEPLTLTLRVVDFTYTDDGGAPKLDLSEDAPQTAWSLRPYLDVPTNVTVDPSSSETVELSVAFPSDNTAGSYYSAIVYSSGEPVDGGNVGLSASGVTLVFASIPGEVQESLTLEKFGAYNEKTKKYSFITADMPQTIAYTLKNEGNVTEGPVGSITLKDMFGGERTINNVNPNGSLALIGQTRTFISCIQLKSENVELAGTTTTTNGCADPGLWPGFYTATLNLFYGQNGNRTQEITGVAHFFYLPWWFVIILVIILASLAFGIWRIVRMIRSKRRNVSLRKSLRRSR